jgi:hypothetical protein
MERVDIVGVLLVVAVRSSLRLSRSRQPRPVRQNLRTNQPPPL